MTPFYQSSKRTQAHRLAILARAALSAWLISPSRLTLAHFGHNATFRVEDDSGAAYSLRVHRPGWQTDAAIDSEMDWLAAIREQTKIVVPNPMRTRQGKWLTKTQIDAVPEARQCVLFRWTNGRFRRRQAGASSLTQLGQLMARLHEQARNWTPPENFTRKKWNADGLLGASLGIDWTENLKHFSSKQQTVAEAMADRLRKAMRELGTGNDVFGLIHADLHFGNVLFEKNEIRAIDFDDCGEGWHLYDMAVPLAWLTQRPDAEILRDAFLRGYRSIRILTPEHEAYLPLFVAVRHLTDCLYLATYWNEPQFREWAKTQIADSLSHVQTYLETER